MTNPFPFDLLFTKATRRWETWSAVLVAALRASQVRTAQGAYVTVKVFDLDGAWLDTTRPIPGWYLARTGAGGLPARDAATGKWGEATVTLYETTGSGADRCETLGTTTVTAYNRTTAVVPANTDVQFWESGGELFYLGDICPPTP